MASRRDIFRALAAVIAAPTVIWRMGEPTRARAQQVAEPEDSARQAKLLADRFMQGIELGPQGYAAEHRGLYTADVETTVERFGFQLRYCLKRNLRMWAAQFSNSAPVPIDWSIPIDPFWLDQNENIDYYFDDLYRFYGRLADGSSTMGFTLRQLPPSVAKENFADGLVAFLAVRFTFIKSNPATKAEAASPGLPFRVFTQRNAQRVRYTMSYFPDFKNPLVFGAPTSPVDGWIQPGLWKFAVDGPKSPLKFDPADFPVPPLREAHLNV